MKKDANRFYVFALIDTRLASRALGKGGMSTSRGQPLALVPIPRTHAYAVVEPLDPASPPIAPTPKRVVLHDRIVRRIARITSVAILPARFGTIATKDAIARSASEIDLATAFDRVRGCVQYTLRVHGPPRPAPKRRVEMTGTAWLRKRRAELTAPELMPVVAATRPFVREVRSESRGADAKKGASFVVLAVAYHLVPRDRMRAWRRAVAECERALTPGVRLTVTGPWPPYAFAAPSLELA